MWNDHDHRSLGISSARMGKRHFKQKPRAERDFYPTPPEAVAPLRPYLVGVRTFAEPCYGDGRLIRHLEAFGLHCKFKCDIHEGPTGDALLQPTFGLVDAIITNPPWSRDLLHRMIVHFQQFAPTWLLFDSDWANSIQAVPFLARCSHIVAVGRVRWVEGSRHTGLDNASWYRFHAQHIGPTLFINEREAKEPGRPAANGAQPSPSEGSHSEETAE